MHVVSEVCTWIKAFQVKFSTHFSASMHIEYPNCDFNIPCPMGEHWNLCMKMKKRKHHFNFTALFNQQTQRDRFLLFVLYLNCPLLVSFPSSRLLPTIGKVSNRCCLLKTWMKYIYTVGNLQFPNKRVMSWDLIV